MIPFSGMDCNPPTCYPLTILLCTDGVPLGKHMRKGKIKREPTKRSVWLVPVLDPQRRTGSLRTTLNQVHTNGL